MVLVGFGIRSLLLPAQTAFVFLQYAEGSSWERAPQSPLFQDGDLEFAGLEPVQLGGEDLGAWEEVVIVNFESTANYQAFLGRIAERWSELFDGSYQGTLVMLNLTSNQEDPQDPLGSPESDVTTEELHDRYQQKAFRVLGKMGAQISVAGTVEGVVVGPEARGYDEYGFAFYPSVNALEVVFTARERVDARVNRDAALRAEGTAGYWAKPYEEFTPGAR